MATNVTRRAGSRFSLAGLAMACAAALLLATPGSAYAFPDNGDSTLADNATHTYCYTSGFTTDASVGAYAMAVLGNTTDMDDLFPIDPPTCSFMETDVWWWELNLAAGVRGTRSCWLESPNGICTSSDLTLDYAELDVGAFDWEDRRKTAVHEVGHSVGLDHDPDCAMMSGQVPDATLQWRTYCADEIADINAAY
ncbi:hypothetical protein ACFQZ4_01485 [Catellatospora coxensis]|uniref:Matrixin n=1 Tax=Catellatospora coxensis TaxID=310354 RepID=A0A8J3P925_9ACTN|nr:hypothetical protein [Catellatospora coxensis]GIG08806.1 hypothetical protein Cco03nite_55060 [Catellatospora coxensis]